VAGRRTAAQGGGERRQAERKIDSFKGYSFDEIN
jgi:hypothetical protein